MAGPCLTIFTKVIIDEDKTSEIWRYIDAVSSKVDGNNFWISGQPLLISLDKELDEEDRELNLDGQQPMGAITLCAMCNNPSSHVLLATAAIKIAQINNGMILIERIKDFTNSPSILTLDGHIKINETDYIVNPEYLCYWLGSEEFRLLK